MEKQLINALEPDGRVLVSFSKHQAEGFRSERILFDRVEGMVRFKGNYSATAFRDGYRDGDHALQGQELIILDFDDQYTIGEAMVDFAEYVGVIATTRNHMKEKHGVVAERFRVILPTDKPIMLEREAFKLMMAEVMRRFVHADPACKNIDRMYYGYPRSEVFYLDGSRLFPWERFYRAAMVRLSERERQRKGRERRPNSDASYQKSYMTFFQNQFVPGNRNNALFQLARWMRDDGVVELERLLREMNSGSGCPLEKEEVEGILRRMQ
jgi:hypothetical protein